MTTRSSSHSGETFRLTTGHSSNSPISLASSSRLPLASLMAPRAVLAEPLPGGVHPWTQTHYLARHAPGNRGDLDDQDRRENERSSSQDWHIPSRRGACLGRHRGGRVRHHRRPSALPFARWFMAPWPVGAWQVLACSRRRSRGAGRVRLTACELESARPFLSRLTNRLRAAAPAVRPLRGPYKRARYPSPGGFRHPPR
jgi:hypothetical protein